MSEVILEQVTKQWGTCSFMDSSMTSETLHHLYDYLVPLVTEPIGKHHSIVFKELKKELNDIATFTDRFMEQAIVEGIRQRFPDHTFIGEEYGENRGESPYEWLIDPIDGTVNFAAGIPMFGTTLALRKNKETIFGIIFDWPNNAIYYAIKGEGAYCGTMKLRVSQRSRLDESIVSICLTSSYNTEYSEKSSTLYKIAAACTRHTDNCLYGL